MEVFNPGGGAAPVVIEYSPVTRVQAVVWSSPLCSFLIQFARITFTRTGMALPDLESKSWKEQGSRDSAQLGAASNEKRG